MGAERDGASLPLAAPDPLDFVRAHLRATVQLPESSMYIFFADDSAQSHPSRLGVGQLVAVGGLFVVCEQVAGLERSINYICRTVFHVELARNGEKLIVRR
jgi:hypothetical protein